MFSGEVLERIFGARDVLALSDEGFLASLTLTRIGLYPEEEDAAVLLDFRAGTEHDTNYVLSVVMSAEGDITDVTMES